MMKIDSPWIGWLYIHWPLCYCDKAVEELLFDLYIHAVGELLECAVGQYSYSLKVKILWNVLVILCLIIDVPLSLNLDLKQVVWNTFIQLGGWEGVLWCLIMTGAGLVCGCSCSKSLWGAWRMLSVLVWGSWFWWLCYIAEVAGGTFESLQ